jgi:hypothetical protein
MLTISSCGCGLAFTDPNAVVTQADIDTLKAFESFLTGLLKEPVVDPSGKPAPFTRYKYVLVDDETGSSGYGWSYMYPVAFVHAGGWNTIIEAAGKGGCIYNHNHYILPGRKEGVASSGSSPYIFTDIAYFEDALAKDVPISYLIDTEPARNYVGRPHELLVSTQQAIKCLQEKMAAQAAGEEIEEGRAAPAADYQISWLSKIPRWAWWAGGATLLVGAGAATALAVRGRKGSAVGAWEDDYDDWEDIPEDELSPWEEQVEAFQHRHPQAPGCPREYDMADALAQQLRKDATFYCGSTESLTEAIKAAWEGRCFHARKFIRKAKCARNPAAAPGRLQRRGW